MSPKAFFATQYRPWQHKSRAAGATRRGPEPIPETRVGEAHRVFDDGPAFFLIPFTSVRTQA
jgi:hypothetical protein